MTVIGLWCHHWCLIWFSEYFRGFSNFPEDWNIFPLNNFSSRFEWCILEHSRSTFRRSPHLTASFYYIDSDASCVNFWSYHQNAKGVSQHICSVGHFHPSFDLDAPLVHCVSHFRFPLLHAEIIDYIRFSEYADHLLSTAHWRIAN